MATFLTSCLLVLVPMFIALGYCLAQGHLAAQRAELTAQRQALDTEWQAMDQTRRVRAVFLAAQRAMQDEAQRAARTSQPGHDHHDQGGQQ